MKPKLACKFLLFSASLLFYACGGSGENNSESNYQIPSPTSEESARTAQAVDINAKSDSKGIGKFASVTLDPVNAALSKKGEAIYSTQCVSCHQLTSERLIGPGLAGITEKRTPEWILNMITNPEQNVKEDPLGKALLEEYKAVMPYQGISEENAKLILEYLRQNDAK